MSRPRVALATLSGRSLVHRAGSGELPVAPPGLDLPTLRGRLTELVGGSSPAVLTAAVSLVLAAQRAAELVAWIGTTASSFFPPDLAESGVDLASLVVVRTRTADAVARAADRLAHCGAFGLLVLDQETAPAVPTPLLARLLGLAVRADLAIVFLRPSAAPETSLGSLISLRLVVSVRSAAHDHLVVDVAAQKDKRHAPGWRVQEAARAPVGFAARS